MEVTVSSTSKNYKHVTNHDSNAVPLSKNELLLGGISNIVIMVVSIISEIWMDLEVSFDHNNINTESDLRDFVEYLASTRLADMVQAGILTFIFPLYLLEYVAMVRTLKICFSKYHVLRTIFSLSYIFYTMCLFIAIIVAISLDAFNWRIYADEASNDVLTESNIVELFSFRLFIVSVSFGIYFGSIAMVSFWLSFVTALYFDSKYGDNLKGYILPSCCKSTSIITKLFMMILTTFTLICAYLSAFAWSHNGFWSLNGGSQIFRIFNMFSSFMCGVWLIWFAISKKYQYFNQRDKYQQFL